MSAVTRLDGRDGRADGGATARSDADAYLAAPLRHHDVGSAEIAYRTFGSGDPVLLVHGWPLSGFTFRALIPHLEGYTAIAVDLPGAGDTRWRPDNDFTFSGQARNLLRFVEAAEVAPFHVVAHDTGGTIARALALLAPERVRSMTLIGTEIPGHRPPWIPFFQRTLALPGADLVFRSLGRSDVFVRSSMGFGNAFFYKAPHGADFLTHFIRPLRESPHRRTGQIKYALGIDWALVDRLAGDHRRITCPVQLIWGADD